MTGTDPAPLLPAAVVATRGLTREFGDLTAVRDVDLAIPAGVIVGLIGPSGCGKTTLVRLLTGILAPTAGDVEVFGTHPQAFTADDRRRFGYMPQLPVLYPNLSVVGNLQFVASMYGLPLRGRRARLSALLDLVDLGPHRHTRFSACSGGMKRRVALAATLVHRPELLFLDEPTAGVDPILRDRFWQHFRALADEGATLVISTQYVGEAALCDLVAVMTDGRLVTLCPPDRLVDHAYGGTPLELRVDGFVGGPVIDRIASEPGVRAVHRTADGLVIVVDDATTRTGPLEQLVAAAGIATHLTPYDPGPDAVFVELVAAARRQHADEMRVGV